MFFVFPAVASTTDEDRPKQLLAAFEQRFAAMDSLIFSASDSLRPDGLPGGEFVPAGRLEAVDNATEAQLSAMKSRTGLQVTGQTYIRPGRNVSYDPEDPLTAYNAKVQAELEWDIFQSSLYKRASKTREIRLQGDIEQLEHEKQSAAVSLVQLKSAARKSYYSQLAGLLESHALNLDVLMETQVHLLQGGKISSDDLLKLISEKAEVDRQMAAVRAEQDMEPQGSVTQYRAARVVEIDTAAFMTHVRRQHRDIRLLSLRMEALDAQRKNTDYLQTMSIQPFVRASYYNRESVKNTYNIDVGVSFKIPLTAETAKKRRVLRMEAELAGYERGQELERVGQELVLRLQELDTYNENIRGEQARMEKIASYIGMRTKGYDNVAGEYSRVARLMEYNTYLQCWERMLGYQYQRDCALIDLQGYLTDEPLEKFLLPASE